MGVATCMSTESNTNKSAWLTGLGYNSYNNSFHIVKLMQFLLHMIQTESDQDNL